jgi:carbonic anhydrase
VISDHMSGFACMLTDRRKDALRSLIISQRMLGTREIAIFRHTNCGMVTFTTEELRQRLREETNAPPEVIDALEFLEFGDAEVSVKNDVEWLKSQPLIIKETVITGWIYDVQTGRVCT